TTFIFSQFPWGACTSHKKTIHQVHLKCCGFKFVSEMLDIDTRSLREKNSNTNRSIGRPNLLIPQTLRDDFAPKGFSDSILLSFAIRLSHKKLRHTIEPCAFLFFLLGFEAVEYFSIVYIIPLVPVNPNKILRNHVLCYLYLRSKGYEGVHLWF
ncbi:hypothetical protein ACJX0J_027592, partial [Zea mays]